MFGNIVKSQYPELVPSFDPVAQILDTSLVKELAAGGAASEADLPQFTRRAGQAGREPPRLGHQVRHRQRQVQARRRWRSSRRCSTTWWSRAARIVEIHGHTDNQGIADENQKPREERAFAVKKWLEEQSPTNFPEARIKVFAHGPTEPLASNATADGRAKNRRVEIVLGTGKES